MLLYFSLLPNSMKSHYFACFSLKKHRNFANSPYLICFNTKTCVWTDFVGTDMVFMFFVPCIVIQLCNVDQQNALFKLMFQFNSSCLLRVSNILCSASRRLYCTSSLIWYVFHAFMQAVYLGEGLSNTSFNLVDCLHKRMDNITYKAVSTTYSS